MKESRIPFFKDRAVGAYVLLTSSLLALLLTMTPVSGFTKVMVHDFENAAALHEIHVANLPNKNAFIQLSTDHPYEGKQCLKLHHCLVGNGSGPILRIPVRIEASVRRLRFMLYGNNSGSRYGVSIVDSSGEEFAYRSSKSRTIDFKDWNEIVIDMNSEHETLGGDQNGKVNSPIIAITLKVDHDALKVDHDDRMPIESDLYLDSLSIDCEERQRSTH
jgi:hypothetical protein